MGRGRQYRQASENQNCHGSVGDVGRCRRWEGKGRELGNWEGYWDVQINWERLGGGSQLNPNQTLQTNQTWQARCVVSKCVCPRQQHTLQVCM